MFSRAGLAGASPKQASSSSKKFLPFGKALAMARALGLTSHKEWQSWYAPCAVHFHPSGGQFTISFGSPHVRPMGVRVVSPTKPRKIPTRGMLPLFVGVGRRKTGERRSNMPSHPESA